MVTRKTYTDARELIAARRGGLIPGTVFIEVEVEDLLAGLLGRRFTDQNGDVVSMESVSIDYDRSGRVAGMVAEPLLVKQEVREAPLCSCGECPYCRQ